MKDLTKLEKRLVYLGITLLSLLVLLGLFRITFVNFVDYHELGYKYDRRTGEITILKDNGYYVTLPFVVKIYTIDKRPTQVCINANNRVLNCKLVRFDTSGFNTFIKWHGVGNYEISNGTVKGSLDDILMSYAYDPYRENIPFLKVDKELKNDEKFNNVVDTTLR
jgi:hypothetical protein